MRTLDELGKRHFWTRDEIIKESHAFDGMTRNQFRRGNPSAFSAARRAGLLNEMTWLKEPKEFHKWHAETLDDVERIKWIKTPYGYLIATVDGEAIFKHRLVMQIVLGRKLMDSECVHHKDGNKLNNDPSNLELIGRSEHSRIHNTTTRNYRRGYHLRLSDEGRRIRSETMKRKRAIDAERFALRLKELGMTREEYFKKYNHDRRMANHDKLLAYYHEYYQAHKEGWNKKRGVCHA